MTRRSRLLLVPGFLLLCGCQSLSTFRMEDDDQGASISDPWSGQVGAIARTEHSPETVNDPLGLREFFTSEKAREIERNVGVGD